MGEHNKLYSSSWNNYTNFKRCYDDNCLLFSKIFSKWCRSKKYMLQYSGKTYFDDYRGKALFESVEDDEWSKYEAAQDIMSLFSNLQTEELRITTQDFQEKGMNKMGHFGFFNPRSMSYWNEIITWLEKDVTKEAVEVEKQ